MKKKGFIEELIYKIWYNCAIDKIKGETREYNEVEC